MVLSGTVSIGVNTLPSTSTVKVAKHSAPDMRQRILDAAFYLFTRRGYAQTSTLEIATRAKASKRDLYALVGKKEDMLKSCITERAMRLRWPHDLPSPKSRGELVKGLEIFGFQLLREVTEPIVVSVFRLAISEAERTPEIAQTLESEARAEVRLTLSKLFVQAKEAGIVKGTTADMTSRFAALLWGDLMLMLLLRSTKRPSESELKEQARKATNTFMKLYDAA